MSTNSRRSWRRLISATLVPALLLALSFATIPTARAAALTVTTLADSGPGSLRQAILDANAAAGADAIRFSVSGTITLASTLPAINDTLTIDGSGQSITISGNNAVQVMVVDAGKRLNLQHLTIANGYVERSFGGAIWNRGTLTVANTTFSENRICEAGAIYNEDTLSVTNSTFSANRVTCGLPPGTVIEGGVILNNGTATISNSTFSRNLDDRSSIQIYGGVINNYGSLSVANSTFSENSGLCIGCSIFNRGTLSVTSSTFSGNGSFLEGGAIFNGGTATIANSTFSGNNGADGGAISNGGTVTITNSTFSNNYTYSTIYNVFGTVTLHNSIFANTPNGGNIYHSNCEVSPGSAPISADRFNLADDGTCGSATVKTWAEINLAPLADNGGSTQTMALQSGSAAINAGDNAVCTAAPVNNLDQRGFTRVTAVDPTCDIGAYEAGAIDTIAPTASPTISSGTLGQNGWYVSDVIVSWNWSDIGSGIDAANCTVSSTSSGEGSITLSATCKDNAGNTGNASYTVKVDKTTPDTIITAQPDDPSTSSNASFSFTSTEMGSTFSCSLDGGTFASCTSPTSYSGLANGSHTFQVKATDVAGNTDPIPASYAWKIQTDTTPPIITPIINGMLGPNDWYISNVTVNWSLIDPESTISASSGCGPTTISTDTSGLTLTCSATSAGGTNETSVTIKRDATPPMIIACESPDGKWHASDASLICAARDDVSGLHHPEDASFSLSTNVPVSSENANASTNSRQVCDNAGNCATAGPISGNKVDKKAPVLQGCDAPDGLWHANNVTLNCTHTDGGSGPAIQTVSLSTNVAAGSETANASASTNQQACDAVGNCAAAPAPISGNKIDRKAPSITISAPTNNATYLLNQAVAASYTCTDGGSGVASCAGPVASGSNIDTAAAGTKTFTVYAVDNVGNSTPPASVSYRVAYDFLGFAAPIDNNGVLNVAKAGQTIPLRWRLLDAAGNPVSTLSSVKVTVQDLNCSAGSSAGQIEEYAAGSSGLQNLGDGYYQFNWKTATAYAKSCKTMHLDLGEGETRTALFQFTK